MTFFFLNVMVDENISDFQFIWFFTTMDFFLENVIFFKTVMVGKIFRNSKAQLEMSWLNKNFMNGKFHEQKFHRANNFF